MSEPDRAEAATPAGARRGRRTVLATAAVVAAVTLLTAGAWRWHAAAPAAADCGGATRALRVVAAPEIAGVVGELVRATDPGPRTRACPLPVVTAADPADVADAIRHERGDRPDVWIPDSSVWTRRTAPAGRSLPQENVSVATSPVVTAVGADTATALGWPKRWPGLPVLLPGADSAAGPVRFSLTEPDRSAATVGVLLDLQAAVRDRPEPRAALATVLRAATVSPDAPDRVLRSLRDGARLAAPATEQRVLAYNAQRRDAGLVAVYPSGGGHVLDYPYLVLAAEHAQRARADRLLGQLRGEPGRTRLRAAGFRDPAGAGTAQPARSGADPARRVAPTVPDTAGIDGAARTLTSLHLGTRMLAVIDVSGSMAEPAGSGGDTKLDLALGAAVNGLALYPDTTQVALWTFAAAPRGEPDHRPLVPFVRLGANPDGVTGRERLSGALASVRPVRGGRTGLYDTALAAVRAARDGWDPASVNSVVLLTDGRNDDPGGIPLDRLIRTLRAEDDPARPVFLITVGYGPDHDRAALSAMSRATGGEMYEARDPRRIREVMAAAIGARACRPSC